MTLEGHDPRNVPAWMGMWTYVEQNGSARGRCPAGWARSPRRSPSRLRDARRHGAALDARARPRALRRTRRRCAHRERHRRRRPRRLRDRPAPAARAAAPPSTAPCRRSRRSSATSALVGEVPDLPARGGAARRPAAGAAHRPAPLPPARTPGRSWGAAGSPRTSSPPCSAPASGCATRSRSGSTGHPVSWCRSGAARRTACCGRAATPSPAGSARARRSRTSTLAGAHATPGAGLPSVGLSAALVAQVIGPA